MTVRVTPEWAETSDEAGGFQLAHLTTGTYTIAASKDDLEFQDMEVMLSPRAITIPDIVVSRYVSRLMVGGMMALLWCHKLTSFH